MNQRSGTTTWILAAVSAFLLAAGPAAWAQLDNATTLSAEQIAQQIAPLHPKTVVLVFDVTMSTLGNGMFSRERAGAATIINDGCSVGDRLVLIQFGTGYKIDFDKTLSDPADKQTLINEIPGAPVAGRGTNIRWPHHAALELVENDLPRKGVIVLLTDSFNDRPALTDPNYPHYLDYYTLKGLTTYPHSPENRDYERLLRTLAVPGIIRQYGIGVGIAPTGRPIERLPQAGQGDDAFAGQAGQSTTAQTSSGSEHVRRSILPWLFGSIFALLVLIWLFWYLLNRPVALRLKLGDRGTPRDYRLRPGAKVGLGGSAIAAAPGDEVFPLAGVSSPAAYVKAQRGGAATLEPGGGDDINVLHNGVPLGRSSTVRIGDEIRLLVPATTVDPVREHRVKLEDPRA